MMVKAHVSPGLRAKTKPQIEHRSSWDHPENSRPSPQCGHRLRRPRRSAVLINFDREGVIHKCVSSSAVHRSHATETAWAASAGFDPLKPYGAAEIIRCAADSFLHYGVKLHSDNSDVNLLDSQPRAQLEAVGALLLNIGWPWSSTCDRP
jgi:hypothetical protein